LPSNEARPILQARNGYIWIGTALGFARFDGYRFETFADKVPPHMRSGEAMSLAEDRQGAIWIGFQGKGILKYAGGRFLVPRSCLPLENSAVTDIICDSLGTIFACTSEGLFCIRGDSGFFVRPLPEHPERGVIAPDGSLYVYRFIPVRLADGAPPRIMSRIFRSSLVSRIHPESATTFLVASPDSLRRLRVTDHDTLALQHSVPLETGSSLLPFDNGTYLVGTRGRGIVRFADNQIGLPTGLAVPRGPALQVHNLLRDTEGGIWATTNAGVFRFARTFIKIVGEGSGLPNEYAWLMHFTRDGTLWVGTGRGGTYRIKDGQAQLILQKDGMPEANITEIFEASDGWVWFGGYTGGLSRMRNGTWQRLDQLPEYRRSKVYSIAEDNSGRIWVGTNYGLYTFEGDRFVGRPVRSQVGEGTVRAIAPAPNGDIYYAAGGGVRRMRNDSVRVFRPKNEPTIYGVFSILVDSGRVWYGTYGSGLYLIRGDSVMSLRGVSSMFGPRIISILEDRRGYLWLNAERELQRVRKADILYAIDHPRHPVRIDIYNHLDGLENIEFNYSSSNSAQMIPDGRLLYASTAGIVMIDPSKADRPETPPPVAIERILADDVPVVLQGAELPAGTRRIEIDYSAVRFQAPGRVTFRYRLAGVDRDWVEADGLQRSVTYTNPGNGAFTFTVTARSENGLWNTQAATTTFTVAPYFYERWSFRIAGLAAVIALLVAGYSIRTRRMRERNRALEEEVNLRRKVEQRLTDSLEEKTVMLKEIHHRVKNNMQVISSLMSLQLGSSNEPMIQEALKESQSRIRSMALVHEILYRSDNFAAVGFRDYLEQLVRQVSHANQKPNVTMHLDGAPLTLSLDQAIPAGLLMNELLTNAIKHAFPDNAAGSITISTRQMEDGLVELSVADTGKGLPADFDITQSTTLGLRLVSSLSTQLGGTLSVKSGEGTTFAVQFPLDAGA